MVVVVPPTILESKDVAEATNVRHSTSSIATIAVDDLQLITDVFIRKSGCSYAMSRDKTGDIAM